MPHQLTANRRIELCAYKNYPKVVKLRKAIFKKKNLDIDTL